MKKAAIINKIFKTNFSSHVKQHTTEKVQFLFFSRFLLMLAGFLFRSGRTGRQAIILGSFEISLIFPNFLRFQILICLTTCEATLYTSLLVIVTLRFTCGEREIWSIIKKSQNIIKVGVLLYNKCIFFNKVGVPRSGSKQT